MLYKIIKTIFDCILFIILVAVVSSVLPLKLPLKSYIVVSGSMEPVIKTGSLIFSQSFNKNSIKVGDIIAFLSPEDQHTVIVHRINNIGDDGSIFTKGDNNNAPDERQIIKDNVIGKTFLTIPHIGQLFNLIHTPIGFILIICLPSFIFIILQSLTVRSALLEIENKKNIKIFLLFFIPLFLLFPPKIHALFIDTAKISGIKFTIGKFPEPSLSSEINSVEIQDQKIKINYTSSSSDFTDFKVCYSYNINPWECAPSDKSGIFVPPQGQGIYFINVLIGKSGQFENKDYTQGYKMIEVEFTPPTSSLDLQKTFDNSPFMLSKSIYNFSDISLDSGNLSSSLDFVLPQNLSSTLYFNYNGTSDDICDFSNLTVSLGGQTILQTGSEEIGLGNWVGDSGLKSFFYQLPIFSNDQNLNLSFNLSPESSPGTFFTISNIGISPISLRVGTSFVSVIDSHDIGSGVGQTSVSIVNNKINFFSNDILGNQESTQSAKIFNLSPIVLNKIKYESVDLYENIDTDLTGYFLTNLSGQTLPVTDFHTTVVHDFLSTGLVILNNSNGDIVDKLYFQPIQNNQVYWQRNIDGIGTWVIVNETSSKLAVSFEAEKNINKLLMTISNISDNFGQNLDDFIEYTIDYKVGSESKQIYGKIKGESVLNNKVDREFYLGTCSSNNSCKPENISIGETIYLEVGGQISGQILDQNIWQIPF